MIQDKSIIKEIVIPDDYPPVFLDSSAINRLRHVQNVSLTIYNDRKNSPEELIKKIKSRIRAHTSIRHVPAKVIKIMDFGAFVNFMGSKDGLVHISELADRRVGKTTDVVKVGDKVTVKVIGFDNRGKIKLSMKELKQKNEKNFNRA